MTIANLFRTLTNLALDRDTFLGSAHNSICRVRGVPSFWPEDYSEEEQAKHAAVRDFYVGFFDGWNYSESRKRTGVSLAFRNGAVLGFRLRELRKEHKFVDAELYYGETLARLLAPPRAA